MSFLKKLKTVSPEWLKYLRAQTEKALAQKPDKPAPRLGRTFGREGAEDVKEIVWTGHAVHNPQGQSYYGAVGLTKTGYYRDAEVQVYGGGEEKWNWSPERHAQQEKAVEAAQARWVKRLQEYRPRLR